MIDSIVDMDQSNKLNSINLSLKEIVYDSFKNKVSNYYRANLLYGNVQRATAFIIQSCTMIASIIGIILIYHVN